MINSGCDHNDQQCIKQNEDEEDLLQNGNRAGTLAFRYSANRHLFLALTNKAIANIIRRGIEFMCDWFILHPKTLEFCLHSFCDSGKLTLIQQIVEDEA